MRIREQAGALLRFALCVLCSFTFLASSPSRAESTAPVENAMTSQPTKRSWRTFRKTAVFVLKIIASVTLFISIVYALRHYFFTLNRLLANQRHPYLDIETANWPSVTIYIPAHNEELVIQDILKAILEVDYPPDKLRIVPVNDRSKDRTREIIDSYVALYPNRIFPFHREDGKPGKSAALKDAMELFPEGDIVLVFDADYLPSSGLIKVLVAPFFDPEVGAVMGRVVPVNTGSKLITRLLDLERSAGYQVDQQARMNLRLVPQYGGTVGGVRREALNDVGGWSEDALAEDTDITYRLLLGGWKTVYENRAECYEEVPETWDVRIRQISRWAKGHNEVMARSFFKLFVNRNTRFLERLDGLLLLGVYAYAPLLVLGWISALGLFYFGEIPILYLGGFSVVSYGTFGNFAAFFEIAAAVRLDGFVKRLRLLPFNLLGFYVSLFAITKATLSQLIPFKKKQTWSKTERFRRAA